MGKIANMRHQLTLQSPVSTRDEGGGFNEEYTDVVDIWCDIKPIQHNVVTQYAQRDMQVKYRITARYRNDIAAGMRLKNNDGTTYEIETVIDPDMRKAYLEITARVQ